MKQAIEITSAAVAAFVLTTLYLQHSQPNGASSRQPPAAATVDVRLVGKGGEVSSRVATGFRDARADVTTQRPIRASAAIPPVAPIAPLMEQSNPEAYETEERELAEYWGGIRNVAPVTEAQKSALLESKLRHQTTLDLALRDAGVKRESLSQSERAYAHRAAARALNESRQNFLIDVKPILSDEQYTVLADFETTEFKRHLAKLQTEINSK